MTGAPEDGGHLTGQAIGGVNAHLKVPALVAGMVAGADSHLCAHTQWHNSFAGDVVQVQDLGTGPRS